MYIVNRRWTNGAVLIELMNQHPQEVRDLIGSVPGFVAYYAARDGDTLITTTVCNDLAGTQESTKRAGEWIVKHLGAGVAEAPVVTEGETFLTL